MRVDRHEFARQVDTGDSYKGQVQHQWNNNSVGSATARAAQPYSLDCFLDVERYRYKEYAPWMPEVMEFASHAGEQVLEVGGGMGTDLAQFARHGAIVTDVELSEGHLQLAQGNFRLRALTGASCTTTPSRILREADDPVLSPGDLAMFDDSGVSIRCIVPVGTRNLHGRRRFHQGTVGRMQHP